ncbi:MAG: hypothetical protein V7756_03240 [Halopseudomonas sp.]|uniref:hypothetical protein n=1 Tax=Halopseudomonas sp. TaxID=2901191 RepID=UPI00300392B1
MKSRSRHAAALLTLALLVMLALVLALGGLQLLLRAWLSATLIWGCLPMGALAVLLTHNLTGGRWGEQSRAVWLALVGSMPVFILSLLPLLAAMGLLFPWAQPDGELSETVLQKQLYLNQPFFVVRSLFYLLVWSSLAWWLTRRAYSRSAAMSAGGLILWVLTLSFFSVDWMMSLSPEFYSDIFGLIFCMSVAGAAMAAGLLLALHGSPDGLPVKVQEDLGNLWLAALLGWAFVSFAQYIIIWSGNLPDEVRWFVQRRASPWQWLSFAAPALFCLLPAAALLWSRVKQSRRALYLLAALCLLGHALHVCWLVLPSFSVDGAELLATAVASVVLLGVLGAVYRAWLLAPWSWHSGNTGNSEQSHD